MINGTNGRKAFIENMEYDKGQTLFKVWEFKSKQLLSYAKTVSQDNAGFSLAKAFISVNQLLRLYLIPDSLFGLCNSLLSTHVKKVTLC